LKLLKMWTGKWCGSGPAPLPKTTKIFIYSIYIIMLLYNSVHKKLIRFLRSGSWYPYLAAVGTKPVLIHSNFISLDLWFRLVPCSKERLYLAPVQMLATWCSRKSNLNVSGCNMSESVHCRWTKFSAPSKDQGVSWEHGQLDL
jgi:hypothetical protein